MALNKIWLINILLLLISSLTLAATKGGIVGVIKDAETGKPLPGANVFLEGTAIGAATNLDGEYRIPGAPAGKYTLLVSYMGYQKVRLPITVEQRKTIRQDAQLHFQVIKGREVVVTAQLEGQAASINQQLSSNTIVNIVSMDKIQELPDQNAAETVGRLPGISIIRDAGEGQKISVRGLAPRMSSITVNGERIPSTDPENRSVDLSMISPDVLAGIEVYKALTPDKDADAIGGTVNYVTKKAREGLRVNTRLETGYNGHEAEYGQNKGSTSLSNRYFNDKLGVVLTGSMQRANRSSDNMEVEYSISGESEQGVANLPIVDFQLVDRLEIRDRYSASLTFDYGFENGDIFFSSFWGKTIRDEVKRRRRYRIYDNRQDRTIKDSQIETELWTNSLRGQHFLLTGILNLDVNWRASYSGTKQKTPFSHAAYFYELSAFQNDLDVYKGPEVIPGYARNRLDETYLKSSIFKQEWVDDANLTAQLDIKFPFAFTSNIAGYIKTGAKARGKSRDRDRYELETTSFGLVWNLPEKYPDRWELDGDGRIKFSNFIETGFDAEDFLNNQYEFGQGLDPDVLNEFFRTYRDERVRDTPIMPYLYYEDPTVGVQSYAASEKIYAGYLMMELNLGQKLMFLPGLRYERTQIDYNTTYALPTEQGESNVLPSEDEDRLILAGIIDTTGFGVNDIFLPMVHLQYRPTAWFDIRMAVTRTLSRSDYYNLVPFRVFKNDGMELIQGNPNLRPAKSWNYDLFFSTFNRLGLFTIGLFAKDIVDVDYIRTRAVRPEERETYGKVVQVTQPENIDKITKVRGFEIELQTNLRSLPSPFDGIVLYANFSRIFSKTFYPFLLIEQGPPPFFTPIFIDTVRSAPMIGQSDPIVNLSVGYEKSGFTGRVSMVYQGQSLRNVGIREEIDVYDDAFIRWDMVMQQKLTHGISLFLNLNNISDQPDIKHLSNGNLQTWREYFGWTGDLGLRVQF